MAKVKYIKLSDALEMLQKTDGGARNCRRAARGKCERG
mgnify:CR=1 FL=1